MGETNISTRRKNSANTFQHLGLKNKTSFHSFAETPIKAAKRKINYHSIYIIQCTHYHSHTFFQILPGLESLVVEQQQSSSERSVRMLWFTICGQDAHTNTSGGGGHSAPQTGTKTLRWQRCSDTVHKTHAVPSEARINVFFFFFADMWDFSVTSEDTFVYNPNGKCRLTAT